MTLIRNYLAVAIRNLLRHPGYALINIAGLSVGLASVILIALFIRHEFSYDRDHPFVDRIYRVLRETDSNEGSATTEGLSGAMLPVIRERDGRSVGDSRVSRTSSSEGGSDRVAAV